VRTPTGTLVLNPSVPVYESYIRVLANFNRVPTLQQRVGNRSWASLNSSYDPQRNDRNDGDKRYMEESGLWTRVEGGFGKLEPEKSTTNAKVDLDFWRMQIGIDKPISTSSEGDALIGGLSFHYGRAIGDVKSYHGKGKIFTDGYGFATTLT
jgi:outer membrane autotransporter protein